jgi:hypothetical protein
MPKGKRGFQKGTPKPANSGRKPGVQNHRTIFIKELLEDAVVRMGGIEGFLKWVKASPENETIFWSQLMPKLVPIQIQGTGTDGSLVVEIRQEELAQKLVEHGLPPVIFGVDIPRLEDDTVINGTVVNGNGTGNGNDDTTDDNR